MYKRQRKVVFYCSNVAIFSYLGKKSLKNFGSSKKSRTFAPAFQKNGALGRLAQLV